MQVTKRSSYIVTSFFVADPPSDGVTEPTPWMAVATAHVYDPTPPPPLTKEGAVYAGAVMKAVEGRATAMSEEAALKAAISALRFQLEALGLG